MKSSSAWPAGAFGTSTRGSLARAGVALALFGLLPSFGATDVGVPASATTAEKPYAFYLGANVSVEWQGKLRPVRNVEGSTFIVDVDGQPVKIPTQFRNLAIKIDDTIKVSPKFISVSGFKAERAYTLDNDPNRLFAEAGRNALSAAAVTDLYIKEANSAAAKLGVAKHGDAPASELARLEGELDAANRGFERESFAQSAPLNSVGDAGTRAGIEAAQELYDAFQLAFDISSPAPLTHPYMVVIMRLRDVPDQPKTTRQWIYAQELETIGSNRRTVRLFRAGFPPGYKLEDVQVHVYDGPTEVPTNLARKFMAITTDEAFQFAVVNYVEQHRTSNLEPVPAEIASPKKVRSRVPADKLGRTYYVKVAKNGLPAGSFANEACTETVPDTDVAAALATLRFYPALKNGKPVEAVAAVNW